MGHVLTCTVSPTTLMAKEMRHFPRLKLPSDEWEAGIRSFADIKDANLKALYKTTLKEKTAELSGIWSDELGSGPPLREDGNPTRRVRAAAGPR